MICDVGGERSFVPSIERNAELKMACEPTEQES